jgi:hypothetical protein
VCVCVCVCVYVCFYAVHNTTKAPLTAESEGDWMAALSVLPAMDSWLDFRRLLAYCFVVSAGLW